MTDRQALSQYAQDRDADAFRHLVLAYKDMVYAVCMRRLHNSADVEDAVQETFIKLARRAGDIRQSVGGWLCAVANTTSLDMIKAGAARRTHEGRAAEVMGKAESAPIDTAAWQEVSRELDDALAGLSVQDRELVIQYFFLGRTQSQVAEELGLVQSTVKRRIDRIVSDLRQVLADKGLATLSIGVLSSFLVLEAKAQAPAALTVGLAKIGVAGFGGTTGTVGVAGAMGAAATSGAGLVAGASMKGWVLGGILAMGGLGLTAVAIKLVDEPKPVLPATQVGLAQPAFDADRALSALRVTRVPAQQFLAIQHTVHGDAEIAEIGAVVVPRLLKILREAGVAPAGPLHVLDIREQTPGSPVILMTVALPIQDAFQEKINAPDGTVLISKEAHEVVEVDWYGSMLQAEPAILAFYAETAEAGYGVESVFAFVQDRFVGLESDENMTRIRTKLLARAGDGVDRSEPAINKTD